MKTKFTRICTSFLLFLAFTFTAFAQQVSGTVTDENSVPLPGATVVVQGTSVGVTTDFDGNYSIEASNGDTLVFSFVGYTTQSVAVGSSSTVNVTMQADSALDEVVVTALGLTRAKKSLGYAVTEVSSENINTIKNHNIANSLVGKVPGINITQSGAIGAGSRIVIRGNNSLSGNTQALIVVDGVPINADGINSGGNEYNSNITGGGISDVNPNDVESITVLKGPNAAALYGARAGNGVILITTKKGSSESKLGVTVNSNTTVENVMFLPKYQNVYGQGTRAAAATDIADFVRHSFGSAADGSSKLYYDGTNKPYTAQPDNVRDFYETGVQSINSVAVESGSDKSSVRFSYTNNSTASVIPNAALNSHNFNIRASSKLSDKLSLDAKATYFSQEINHRPRTGSEGLTQLVHTMPRTVRINDLRKYQMDNPSSDADYAVISYDRPGTSTGNPYWLLYNDIDDEKRGRFFGFAKLDYQFTDWLSGFVRVGTDITNVASYWVRQPGHHYYPTGRLERNTNRSGELNSEFLLTAKGNLTSDIDVVFNVGGNLSKRTYEAMMNFGEDFKLNSTHFLANTNQQLFTETPMQTKKVNSLYASANFSYDGWAYLDVTARNDWSSTLGADNRSYMYTSVNLALLLEQYIAPDFFDLFKVRGSIANVGNDTSPYQLVQTFSVPGQGYLGLTTLSAPSTRLNPDLKPENIESSEFGLELAMLDNNLTVDLSVYDITTTDLIFNVPVPAATGYSYFLENVGKVTNKGIEIALGYNVINSDKLQWNTSVFASKNENELIELIDDLNTLVYLNTNSGNASIQARVGGGIGDIYGNMWDEDASGNKIVNADGKPKVSTPDNYLGNAQPDWIGGWSNTFYMGDFSVNFLIDGRFGGSVYSSDSARLDQYGVSERSLQYRESGVVLDAVDINGAANTTLITGQEYWGRIADLAAPYVYKQDNVRLREFAIGYMIDDPGMLGLESANIQLIGRNLFFFNKKAEDIDPEAMLGTNIAGQGIALGNIPTLRSLGLNVTLKF